MGEPGEITMVKVNTRELAPIAKLQEPLDDDNWSSWQQQITRVFRLSCTLPIIDGTILKPPDTSGDCETWEFNDACAQILITQNVTRAQIVMVAPFRSYLIII